MIKFKDLPDKIQARIVRAHEETPTNPVARIEKYINKFPDSTSFRKGTIHYLLNKPTGDKAKKPGVKKNKSVKTKPKGKTAKK